jgi:hypothetical protein
MSGSRFAHFDLRTPVEPGKRRLGSFPECPWVLISVLIPGTQWYVLTNTKLLIGGCVRHSMTQTLFMAFINT